MVDEFCGKKPLLNIWQTVSYLLKIIFDFVACASSTKIACSSKKVMTSVASYYRIPLEKMTLLYFGVNDDTFRVSRNVEKEYDLILVQTDHIRKGTKLFLETLMKLKLQGHQYRSLIIGSNNTSYENLSTDYGLTVTFMEKIPRQSVITLLSKSKMLVVPSSSEGFCLPVVEAGLVGCPSIVSPVGSLPEIVIDGITGLICNLNTESLGSAITSSFENNEWLSMGDKSKEVYKKFTIKEASNTLLNNFFI